MLQSLTHHEAAGNADIQSTIGDALDGAIWIAAEDARERAEREAGFEWTWGEAATDERPRQFVWRFSLDSALADARLLVGARKGFLGVWVDGQLLHAPKDPTWERELEDLPLGTLAAGEHRVAVEVRLFHPFIKTTLNGGVAALLRGLGTDGHRVNVAPRPGAWRTRLEAAPQWHAMDAALDDGWFPGREPSSPIHWHPTSAHPARCLRRAFVLDTAPVAATLVITALGGYEAQVNGQRVDDALLTPENSDYRHRLLVRRHDVRAMLHAGENALGVMVGDGFYASEVLGRGRYPFGDAPRRLLARLDVTLADGRVESICTDSRWRAHAAPVTFSEIYHGETYDARLEQAGWSGPDFDDKRWDAVAVAPEPPCALQWHEGPPIRATMTLAPRTITRLPDGDHVVDFGQNFAGWCRLQVHGEAGREITLRFAELQNADGSVDMRNLRRARCTDRYVLRGDAVGEIWEPRFTYHGFRYVQVRGWPGELRAQDIAGVVVHSDLPVTGHFSSTQPLLQGLWHNTFWSQRSNFVGLPTDCPQRDERLGWTGDAQIFWPTAANNMDVRGFTRRFLADLRASQRADGAYADTNPPALPAYGAHGWSDAGVILPWTVWRHYGDATLLDEHWLSMTRWMRWIEEVNADGLWRHRREVDFGDWLSLDAKHLADQTTPKLLTATACWARMLGCMQELSSITGRHDEARRYEELRVRVVQAFRREFIREDGRIGIESHTGYILSLAFDLVPQALRQAAGDHLARGIRDRGTLLTTGFLGTPFSLDVLADTGHGDLAADLLLRTQFPSWGYMVANGATTIWERWNGDTGDVSMNSFNHYALGAVTGFLYRRIAGIDAGTPGFGRVRVAPILDSRLGSGTCRLDTLHGPLESSWGADEGGNAWLEIKVPDGVEIDVSRALAEGRDAELHVGRARIVARRP